VVILTLDTTTRAGSCALWLGDRVIDEKVGNPERSHAERLPTDLARLLAQHHLSIKDVTLYAIASGPGSFTGLRVGISTLQALALVYGNLIVPISALEALAYCGARDASADVARRGTYVAAWMEAFRGEVFSALYIIRRGRDEFPKNPSDPFRHRVPLAMLEEIAPPTVGPPELVADKWSRLIGEPATSESMIVIGDAVPQTTAALTEYFPKATMLDGVPIAGMLARLAAREPERGVLPHAVMPVYVRPPDAQLARDRLHQQQRHTTEQQAEQAAEQTSGREGTRGNVGPWSIG
jgi:tRNA threonylcarbamoyladenosine biosynthesis protein TsaB